MCQRLLILLICALLFAILPPQSLSITWYFTDLSSEDQKEVLTIVYEMHYVVIGTLEYLQISEQYVY